MIECLATDAELVAEGLERAIPGLITAAMTAIQAVRQGSHEKWVDCFLNRIPVFADTFLGDKAYPDCLL